MTYKVFVDGREGTTGLQIIKRLKKRNDIQLLEIDADKRKDAAERKRLINQADMVFLCLPDDAARESVSMVENKLTRIIDASTAHRTKDGWAYGLPELSPAHRQKIKNSKRVSVPGCYATGFNILLYPLIKEGIVPNDYPISCHAVSGYSGAGKKMIAQYETPEVLDEAMKSPRFYAMGLTHKHLPEMQKVCGLAHPPIFTPIIGSYYKGMIVAIPLFTRLLPQKRNGEYVSNFLAAYYKGQQFINVFPYGTEGNLKNGFLDATGCNGTNKLEINVTGNEEQMLLTARLDNLGKGASGAAVQCMNIMLGLDEEAI